MEDQRFPRSFPNSNSPDVFTWFNLAILIRAICKYRWDIVLTSNTKRTALANRLVVIIAVEEKSFRVELLEMIARQKTLTLMTQRRWIRTKVSIHTLFLLSLFKIRLYFLKWSFRLNMDANAEMSKWKGLKGADLLVK